MQNPVEYIPLRELWRPFNPLGFDKGIFVVSSFEGYIDESCDGDQNLFALSCLVATGKEWAETTRSWELHLKAVNKKLKKQGRPLISRYHASDCSGRRNEFEGWSLDERDVFVRGLFGVIERSRGGFHSVAYDIELDDLCEVFPEWAGDRLEAAYALLPRFLMYTLGDDFNNMSKGGRVKITLFHDRTGGNGKYDPTILRAFNRQMSGTDFRYRDHFNTITAWGWEDCIALQPADLIAFEWLKNAQAKLAARRARRSFEALIDMNTFGIHGKSFNKEILTELRARMEADKSLLQDLESEGAA